MYTVCLSRITYALISLPPATLKAVQNDSTEMLNVVCEFPSDLFEAENLQQALVMAVEKDCALNVAQLAKGTHKLPNINEALTRAKEIQAYGAYTVLLMLQAAYTDDSQLVLALFGKETTDVLLTSDPDFPLIQSVLRNDEFPISIVCEVAEQLQSMAFCTAVESTLTKPITGSVSSKTPPNPAVPNAKTSVAKALRSQGEPSSLQWLIHAPVVIVHEGYVMGLTYYQVTYSS